MACRSACLSQDHESFGQCCRASGLQVAGVEAHQRALKINGADKAYRDARAAGLQPDGSSRTAVEKAWRLSDAMGAPYRGDA